MPRCRNCGKAGFLLRLNRDGLCRDCEAARFAEIENAERKLQQLHDEREARKQAIASAREERLRLFRKNIFPLVSVEGATLSAWSDAVHNSEKQLNLQMISIYEPIAFLVNTEKNVAVFTDYTASKIFCTSLDECSCEHFQKTGKPCEHIYRLYLILNGINLNASDMPTVSEELYARFHSLPADSKLDFVSRITYLGDHGKDCMLSDEIRTESDAGLLVISKDINYAALLDKSTKDEIVLWLKSVGIDGCSFNWSKARVAAWTLENAHEELAKRFARIVHISVNAEVSLWREKYLIERNHHTFTHPHFWEDACK